MSLNSTVASIVLELTEGTGVQELKSALRHKQMVRPRISLACTVKMRLVCLGAPRSACAGRTRLTLLRVVAISAPDHQQLIR